MPTGPRSLYLALGFALVLALFSPAAHADPITYTYQGNAFTTLQPGADPSQTFTCSLAFCGIEGSFTLSSPLGANYSLSDVSTSLVSYSFTDGQYTFTNSNSYILEPGTTFDFGTNADGTIVSWDIGLEQNGNGAYFYSQNGVFTPSPGDEAFDQSDVGGAGPEGFNFAPGNWSVNQATVTPEPPTWTLLGAGGLLLLGIGAYSERRRGRTVAAEY